MNRKQIARGRELGPDTGEFYEVFARKTSDDPLCHIGSVGAPNTELAEVRAWFIFDEYEWREMCLVPSGAIIPITERDKRVKIKVH